MKVSSTMNIGFVPSVALPSSSLAFNSPTTPSLCRFRSRTLHHNPTINVRMMADDKSKNPLAGLGGLGNIMDAMKKAQEFTSVAKDLQEQLKNTEIVASVRDGQVTVTMTAQQVPIKVDVSEELLSKGSDEVSAAVTEAVIAAHTKSSQYMKEKMGNLTKEFGIPQPPQ